MTWYIWWLAVVCAIAAAILIVIRSSNDDTDHIMPAAEVERIETRRFEEMARAPASGEGAVAVPGAALPGTAT